MEKPQFSKDSPEISPTEAALFAAEIGESPSLDLHGMDSHEAIRAMDSFLNSEFMQGSEAVRIIHGRGQGILRKAVHAALQTHPLVAKFRDAVHHGQQGGVTVIALHRK
jgi:DNA mismatch repair protein MutS2